MKIRDTCNLIFNQLCFFAQTIFPSEYMILLKCLASSSIYSIEVITVYPGSVCVACNSDIREIIVKLPTLFPT